MNTAMHHDYDRRTRRFVPAGTIERVPIGEGRPTAGIDREGRALRARERGRVALGPAVIAPAGLASLAAAVAALGAVGAAAAWYWLGGGN